MIFQGNATKTAEFCILLPTGTSELESEVPLFQFKILKTWQLIKQMTSNFSAQEKQKALFLIITYLGQDPTKIQKPSRRQILHPTADCTSKHDSFCNLKLKHNIQLSSSAPKTTLSGGNFLLMYGLEKRAQYQTIVTELLLPLSSILLV